MSVNSNSQNPQAIQARLMVREQEINALKVQNRHLLAKLDEAEKTAKPNQINTQFVADEVQRHLDPVISKLQATITNSFEILQSTMRGIYQQSQRSQQAVEEMSSHSRDLEIRMNEQRKADQNYYQDKIFSMMGAFCDRVERQIELRLKSLSIIEVLNAKQNEVLSDVESMKTSIGLMQKNSDASRGEISRIERNAEETNEKLIDMQVQTQSSEELIRDTLQQIQNHRSEFKLIRAELRLALDYVSKIAQKFESQNSSSNLNLNSHMESDGPTAPPAELLAKENAGVDSQDEEPKFEINEQKLIDELIENKHRELEMLEKNISEQDQSKDDVAMLLALLRAQKSELQKVAENARAYLTDHVNQSLAAKNKNNSSDHNDQKL